MTEKAKSTKIKKEPVTPEMVRDALVECGCWQTLVAEKLGISSAYTSEIINSTPWLKEFRDNLQEKRTDLYEQKLDEFALKADNLTAVIFYLKTKGRSRGYVEENLVMKTEKLDELLSEIKKANGKENERQSESVARDDGKLPACQQESIP